MSKLTPKTMIKKVSELHTCRACQRSNSKSGMQYLIESLANSQKEKSMNSSKIYESRTLRALRLLKPRRSSRLFQLTFSMILRSHLEAQIRRCIRIPTTQIELIKQLISSTQGHMSNGSEKRMDKGTSTLLSQNTDATEHRICLFK